MPSDDCGCNKTRNPDSSILCDRCNENATWYKGKHDKLGRVHMVHNLCDLHHDLWHNRNIMMVTKDWY